MMPIDTSQIVNKAWNYAHVLRDDGLSHMEWTAQISVLCFPGLAGGTTLRRATGRDSSNKPSSSGRVDRRLFDADTAKTHVEHALQRAARLRQAILTRAFEGKLVPQDPTDEPASQLLARIKAPSSAREPAPNKVRRGRELASYGKERDS